MPLLLIPKETLDDTTAFAPFSLAPRCRFGCHARRARLSYGGPDFVSAQSRALARRFWCEDGNVTIRGVTRPVTLTTILTQDRATLGQENPELTLNLKGTVDRTDFGMTAYNGLVGPQVTLDIRASIKRG